MATPNKRVCPVSRVEFNDNAKPLSVIICEELTAEQEALVRNALAGNKHSIHTADDREFGTGSLGWYLSAKAPTKVGTVTADCQIGVNITVIGSKELPPTVAN